MAARDTDKVTHAFIWRLGYPSLALRVGLSAGLLLAWR